jgi:pantoate--beta-alanine ligase
MKVVRSILELKLLVSTYKSEGKTIGFVPTMGALHEGHISLLDKSLNECDLSIVSIYVNPSQFNQQSDFKSYPRNEIDDILKLETGGCDVAFIPEVSDIESLPLPSFVDLGSLENVMEGSNRPGHFKGVIEVVHRLFTAVKPNKAFFGEKDFQQVMVVRTMVSATGLDVEIVDCKILRESSGLAMSSRNVRLSAKGKVQASGIYKVLIDSTLDSVSVKANELKRLGFEIEYVENHKLGEISRLFVAVWLEGVRLIDNIAID